MLTLMLHRVMPKLDPGCYFAQRGTAISQEKFLTLLNAIEPFGYWTSLETHVTDSNKTLCITFDDGYKDNIWAFEQLHRRGMQAVLFPVKDFIHTGFSIFDDIAHTPEVWPHLTQRHRNLLRRMTPDRYRRLRLRYLSIGIDQCPQNLFMSEQDIKCCSTSGVRLGIHGATHKIWPALAGAELEEEIASCSNWLLGLTGQKPELACFPHGKPPKREHLLSLQERYTCFGVDTAYDANSKIIRRIWFKEDSNIEQLLS